MQNKADTSIKKTGESNKIEVFTLRKKYFKELLHMLKDPS